jgi:hypothetical protein
MHCVIMHLRTTRCFAGLRRKGALVADGELQRIMAHVDLDGNNTLDFQVGPPVRVGGRACACGDGGEKPMHDAFNICD